MTKNEPEKKSFKLVWISMVPPNWLIGETTLNFKGPPFVLFLLGPIKKPPIGK
jgi:hypothetical protein